MPGSDGSNWHDRAGRGTQGSCAGSQKPARNPHSARADYAPLNRPKYQFGRRGWPGQTTTTRVATGTAGDGEVTAAGEAAFNIVGCPPAGFAGRANARPEVVQWHRGVQHGAVDFARQADGDQRAARHQRGNGGVRSTSAGASKVLLPDSQVKPEPGPANDTRFLAEPFDGGEDQLGAGEHRGDLGPLPLTAGSWCSTEQLVAEIQGVAVRQ